MIEAVPGKHQVDTYGMRDIKPEEILNMSVRCVV